MPRSGEMWRKVMAVDEPGASATPAHPSGTPKSARFRRFPRFRRPPGRPSRRLAAHVRDHLPSRCRQDDLTEKLLLFGGAIHVAGAVKARGEARRARSDWMKIEQQRGISVTTSVMNFEYGGAVFNLLDTPGHEDFSEDTYRTLTAVDSAVMVIDAAKGIEAQTRKLFEMCRLRDVPIITFINKMDRESRDPIELLDEIASTLALDVTPMSWPVGSGQNFKGTYDLARQSHAGVRYRGSHAHRRGDRELEHLRSGAGRGSRAGARRLSRLRHGVLSRRPSDAGVSSAAPTTISA